MLARGVLKHIELTVVIGLRDVEDEAKEMTSLFNPRWTLP